MSLYSFTKHGGIFTNTIIITLHLCYMTFQLYVRPFCRILPHHIVRKASFNSRVQQGHLRSKHHTLLKSNCPGNGRYFSYLLNPLLLLSTNSHDSYKWVGESDVPACGPPNTFSDHMASSTVTPAGSVHTSMGDNVVRMWVRLKR